MKPCQRPGNPSGMQSVMPARTHRSLPPRDRGVPDAKEASFSFAIGAGGKIINEYFDRRSTRNAQAADVRPIGRGLAIGRGPAISAELIAFRSLACLLPAEE